MSQGTLDIRVVEPTQGVITRGVDREDRQTPLSVAVLGDLQAGDYVDGGLLGVIEVTEGDKMVGQRSALIERPSLEGGHELNLIDQPILEREQSE
jgi:hypothetical protein